MANLRFEPQSSGNFHAYSGQLIVGTVAKVTIGENAGKWCWHLTAVSTAWICLDKGWVTNAQAAKRSLKRAWNIWLKHADLAPVQG